MTQTVPPSITPSPVAPDRADRATFSPRATAWADWVKNHAVAEIAAVATNVYNNAIDAFSSATTATAQADLATTNGAAQVALATTQAGHAAASAAAAAATAGAEPWVSGQVYAQYAACVSLIDAQTYRRTTAAGSGIIDPKNDTANYVNISMSPAGVQTLSNKTYAAPIYPRDDDGTISGGTWAIDYANGPVVKATAGANITSITMSNWPASGTAGHLRLMLSAVSYSITFPAWKWIKSDLTTTTTFADLGLTLPSANPVIIDLFSDDGGTTMYATVGRN